ncbi:hypothetical protein RR48_11422 [Papilio machaon]|uniref:Uncharacterized protein n=1 Tax=Papilio machaon TaxID=76193 RepID=A0A194QN24_PAPMA|nr:hypothetical protein RR48_11422 [Papilio machaon]
MLNQTSKNRNCSPYTNGILLAELSHRQLQHRDRQAECYKPERINDQELQVAVSERLSRETHQIEEVSANATTINDDINDNPPCLPGREHSGHRSTKQVLVK